VLGCLDFFAVILWVFQEKTVCSRCFGAKKDQKVACFLFGISIRCETHEIINEDYLVKEGMIDENISV